MQKTHQPKPHQREKNPTALQEWMDKHNLTDYAVAKALGCDPASIKYWRYGQGIPSLSHAFKIERITAGAVPAVYWLSTPQGKIQMAKGANWESIKANPGWQRWKKLREKTKAKGVDAAMSREAPNTDSRPVEFVRVDTPDFAGKIVDGEGE